MMRIDRHSERERKGRRRGVTVVAGVQSLDPGADLLGALLADVE